MRFLRFNLVGVLGCVLQLVLLALLTRLGLHYLAATAAAVEAAVLHNFVWHERWTWRDRRTNTGKDRRFLEFHGLNGGVSLAGNLVLMPLLVRGVGLGVLPANLAAVVLCAGVNFLTADRLVFSRPMQPRGGVGVARK